MGGWPGFLTLALSALCAAGARADPPSVAAPEPAPAWFATLEGTGSASSVSDEQAARWLEQRKIRARSVELPAHADELTRSRLRVLGHVEQALITARAHAARLEEQQAFELLSRAEQALRAELDMPGAHAWLAELWIALAVVAGQRDELGLARTYLARAASVDPERQIGAAEAKPSLVGLAQTVARARDAASRSRFRIEVEPATARVFIDGEAVDTAREVVVAPGVHVLRVYAPGYSSYAVLLDTFEGTRAPVRVALTELPGTQLRRLLASLDEPKQAERLASALAAETHTPVWLFQTGVEGRALALACHRSACEVQAALELDAAGALRQAAVERPGRGWLTATKQPVSPAPRRQSQRRLWPWLSASTALVVAAVVTTLATRDPESQRERELIVDPGPTR